MVSLEDFNKLASHMRTQDDAVRLLRQNRDEAGHKIMDPEKSKKIDRKSKRLILISARSSAPMHLTATMLLNSARGAAKSLNT